MTVSQSPSPSTVPVATWKCRRCATFWLGYATSNDWQLLVLPAVAEDVEAVLLPDRELITAESALDVGMLAALLTAPKPTRVELLLPKFRVGAQSELTTALFRRGV
jgi:serpin B